LGECGHLAGSCNNEAEGEVGDYEKKKNEKKKERERKRMRREKMQWWVG
jgi:hypothetical protein